MDIRYHLASLVAVFFALGLGILVGMSISSGDRGDQLREQWMAAIESQLEALRLERREMTDRLEAAESERDRYREFAEDAVAALIHGRLAGEKVVVVALGPQTKSAQRVLETLKIAGARAESLTSGLRDERTGTAANPDVEPASLLESMLGSGSTGAKPSGDVVAVLSGPPGNHLETFERLHEAAAARDLRVVAVVDGDSQWQRLLDERAIDYITHGHNPMGALSLVFLLASGETGRFGEVEGLPGWPKHLLALTSVSGEPE